MAQRNVSELLAGAIVLIVAIGFLGYAVANTGRSAPSGYTLHAKFERIDGLNVGADVRVAGVKVGRVAAQRIDPQTFQAVVDFTVADNVKLPTDTSAEITTDGLLGGKYLALVPGGAEQTIPPGGTVTITQSAISLEQLLGKFIFSVSNLTAPKKEGEDQGDQHGSGTTGQEGQGAGKPGLLPPLK
jgi:phospholipid/cholesterol/gamma-HCH transport system substrate-binding protein